MWLIIDEIIYGNIPIGASIIYIHISICYFINGNDMALLCKRALEDKM